MKLNHKLFLLLFVLVGCKDIVDPGQKDIPIDTSVIMPLKVGNSWTYKSITIDTLTNDTSSIMIMNTIQSEKMIGNEKWFVDNLHGIIINRSNGLWSALNEYDTTFIAKYPAVVGDTFNMHQYYQSVWKVISTDSILHTDAGSFKCYVYYNTDSNGHGVQFYSPGIGLVYVDGYAKSAYSNDFYFKLELTSFTIK
jgi:hypothetical protein